MKRVDLPETLYIPSIQMPSGGTLDAQFQADDGTMAHPVFGDLDGAVKWMEEGGLERWNAENDSLANQLRAGAKVVVRSISASEHLPFLAMCSAGQKRYVHFEPAIGSLFAPQERRVDVAG